MVLTFEGGYGPRHLEVYETDSACTHTYLFRIDGTIVFPKKRGESFIEPQDVLLYFRRYLHHAYLPEGHPEDCRCMPDPSSGDRHEPDCPKAN